MSNTLVLGLAFLAACAALQLPLFALPLLYLRWRSMLNNFEAFFALSLILVINLVLHPLLITLLISSTIAPRLLAYRAALLPRVQEFAAAQIRGAPSRVAAPLRKGVAGLGELGWAVAGVWFVWVFVGRTAALAVAVWVVKTSFESVEKGRVAGEVEGRKVSARTDVAVRE